jgi:hypothetical protein
MNDEEKLRKIRICIRIEQILLIVILIVSGYLAWSLRPGGVVTAEKVYIGTAIIFIAAVGCNICRYLVIPIYKHKR